MRIALDFDGTYTEHPALWDAFIALAKAHGHTVNVVTLRHPVHDRIGVDRRLEQLGAGIVYCDGRPKHEVAKERGLSYTIWIEDDPRCVHEGSRINEEQLAAWRKNDVHKAPDRREGEKKSPPLHRRS